MVEDRGGEFSGGVEFTAKIGPGEMIQLPETIADYVPADCDLTVNISWVKEPVVYNYATDEEWRRLTEESMKRAEIEDLIEGDYSDRLQK